VALTRLQADAFVTSDRDLAEAVSGLVATATPDAYSAAYVVSQPSCSAIFHACCWSTLSPRKRTLSELIRRTRSSPSARVISPPRAAS